MSFKSDDKRYDSLLGDAYKNLNDAYVMTDVEFEEPVVVDYTDVMDGTVEDVINDNDYYNSKGGKENILIILGVVLILVSIFIFVRAWSVDKTVEFSTKGIDDIEDWNEFKDNCSKKKKDAITIKIIKKDEVVSEEKLVFDGSKYSYGDKGKKYKYLLDEIGTLEDTGVDIRFIVLSDKKYKFEQVYLGLINNNEQELEKIDIEELKDSVNGLKDTLGELDKALGEDDVISTDDAEVEIEENTKKYDEYEEIEYKFIYCY